MYVSPLVFLIVVAAFIEGLVVLLATQDFNGAAVATDEYSIPLSLVVLVQLVTPMAAALLKKGDGSGPSGQGAAGAQSPQA